MSVTERTNRKLSSLPEKLSDLIGGRELSVEEKAAINEAERLADEYSDIKPDHLVISDNHFFNQKIKPYILLGGRSR